MHCCAWAAADSENNISTTSRNSAKVKLSLCSKSGEGPAFPEINETS